MLRKTHELRKEIGQRSGNMQQDMQCDVTCCTVTSASLLAILCLASGRSENTRFTDKRIEQHQHVIQWSEGRFTPISLSAATRVSEKAETHQEFLSEMYDQKGVDNASHYD